MKMFVSGGGGKTGDYCNEPYRTIWLFKLYKRIVKKKKVKEMLL